MKTITNPLIWLRLWPILVLTIGCLSSPMVSHGEGLAENTAAELILDTPQGAKAPALLLESTLEGEVNGLVASITLTQRFENPSNEWVHGRYVFPMPEQAAVDSLTITVGERVIRGVVKEKEQAKREFQAAKANGKKAGLLEQHRPNLFSMSVANIPPNSEITTEITWVETVQYAQGRFSLRLPTTLTPRFIPSAVATEQSPQYIPDQDITIDPNNGWAQNNARVPDAAAITPPQIRPAIAAQEEEAQARAQPHLFSLNLTLNAGIALADIVSVTHAIDVTQREGDQRGVTLSNGRASMDRDLVLEWTPDANHSPSAAVFSQQLDGQYHNLVMVMPPARNIVQTLPREILFIIDSSGSMAGVSMAQAKQGLKTALGYLSPSDRFNIIDFDSTASSLFSSPREVNTASLARAHEFISSLVADGGTNMREALGLAFTQPVDQRFLRQIVFITDGSVGNEAELFNYIHHHLDDARLFTVGIGSAPNSHFMRGAARYGRGTFQFIDALDQAAGQMAELFGKLNRPVMRDIQIDWGTSEVPGETPEFFPARINDLYVGEPIMVVSRSSQPLSQITVSGQLAGTPWSQNIAVTGLANSDNLDKVWARRKVEDLESQRVVAGRPVEEIKKQIIEIGVLHQLVTRFTSFIAVEEVISRPVDAIAKNQQVANLMPKGNTMPVPIPNTATPSTLLMILGGLCLLIGYLLQSARLSSWRPKRLAFLAPIKL